MGLDSENQDLRTRLQPLTTTLVQAWEFLSGHVRLTIMSAGPDKALHNMSADRHAPFLDAIEHGDGTEGRRVVHEHMRQAADRVVGALSDGSGAA